MLQENATVNVTLMGTNAIHVRLDGILSLHVMVRVFSMHKDDQIMKCVTPISECNCNQEGSENTMCDVNTGKCPCKTALIVGDQCDACAVGNFNFPNCEGTQH